MSPRTPSTPRTVGDLAAIALFVLAIGIPMGARFLDAEADESTLPELRRPLPAPRLPRNAHELGRYPGAFEGWLNDCFGFRGTLIRWHNVAKVFGFGVTPSDSVVVGPDRWIFTTINRVMDTHRGLAPLSDELLELWKNAFENRRDWLRERGVHYLVVICPGKPTIYPEQLPARYPRGETTPLDQLLEYMEWSSDVELVDLRASLLEAKSDDRPGDWLYYRYGTHWTQRGDHLAYVEIVRRLQRWFPDMEPWPASAFERELSEELGDHWGGRLRMKDLLPQESLVLKPRQPRRARRAPDGEQGSPGRSTVPDPGLPRTLMIHDSFGVGLIPFLGEHFAHLSFSEEVDLDPELIAAEQPDLVIQVMVERKLLTKRPNDWGLRGTTAQEAFEASREVLLDLDDDATRAGLEPWRHARLVAGEGGDEPLLTLRCRWSGQGVILPSFDLPPGRYAVVRVDLQCPKESRLNLLYKAAGQADYTHGSSVDAELTEGRNVLHLSLLTPDLVDRLVLILGTKGAYELNGLEVRAFAPGE